jgi:glycerol-3-phosphate acyltransferase PlsY
MNLALTILAAYLSGSIPSGVWIGRMVRGIDIRKHGSGNIGAANVARVVGVPWGVTVGLIDVFKGFAPIFWLGPIASASSGLGLGDMRLILGAAAVLGHLLPVFAGFKGGKGVLTGMGVMIALMPFEVAIAVGIWGIVFAISRTVSLGSLTAALALLVVVFARRFVFHVPIPSSLLVATLLLVILLFWTHRSNISRLKKGRESRFRKA